MNQSTLPLGTTTRAVACALAAILSSSAPFAWAGDLPVIEDVDPCPQCRVVGPGGLSEITVTFDTDVNFAVADVSVRTRASMGADVGFTLAGTSGSDTFTIVLDDAVETDMVTVVIDYTITSVGTDEALDGEVSDPRSLALPSGDGLPGGQAVLQFAVLQGDVNGDFAVNSLDQALVINHLFEKADPCTCDDMAPFDLLDVDGNGVVDFDDLNLVSAALGLFIPETDLDAPTVELSPENGDTVCGTLDTVVATFSESLAPDTATATTLFALDTSGELQASSSATLGGGDDVIDFTFDPPLSINVDYDFTLSESIMDPSGELLNRTLFSVSTSEPIIDVEPIGQSVCELDTVTFEVQASGMGILTYQWRLEGGDLLGENDSTLTIDSAEMSDEGDYDVVVTDSAGCSTTSGVATLTVDAFPTIDEQPIDQTVCAPNSVEFTVEASGAGTLEYQWRKDGVNLPGETDSTLTIDPTGLNDAGSYDVVIRVESTTCFTISDTATLTVDASPIIDVDPIGQTVCELDSAEFTVVASGVGELSYQWRKDSVNLDGEIADTLTIDPADIDDAGDYDVVITDGALCTATSAPATLTVNNVPNIDSQPDTVSVCDGAQAQFSVGASGAGTLSYQWRKGGIDIDGADADTLIIDPAGGDDAGDYDVVITDESMCSTVSDTATLTVSPTIITQPEGMAATEGDTVELTVVADGAPPLMYQWRKDGEDIVDEDEATLTIDSAITDDAGLYDVLVTDADGCETLSEAATLTVDVAPVGPPEIQTQPTSQSACEGDSIEFTVVATGGSGPLTHQWTRDGVELMDGGNISGATTDTLTLDPVDADDEDMYEVTVSDDAGAVTSDSAELTVNTDVPTITSQPTDQTVIEGEAAVFSVTASGLAPLSYQWRMDGSDLAGAIGTILTIPGADAADAGDYDVVVTDGNGCSTLSATVTLDIVGEVIEDLAVIITSSHPSAQTVCEGEGVTLSVSGTGLADLTFQWSLDGVEIAEATGSTLTIDAAEIGDAGDYTVDVSDGTDSLNSATATLTVEQSPTIVTSPAGQTIDAGAAVSFSVTADGTAPLSYQWSVDGEIIAGATGSTLTLTSDEASAADGRFYQVTVTNVCGSATSVGATLTVTGGDGDPAAGGPFPDPDDGSTGGDDGGSTGGNHEGGGDAPPPCGALFDDIFGLTFGLIMLPLGWAGLRFGRSRRA